jgi:nucleoside-diphosphate-sugar epimerase
MTSKRIASRNKSSKSLRSKRVLVTGADGFIGAHLVQALQKEGAIVELFKGDVLARESEKFYNLDYVFHLAAITDMGLAKVSADRVFEVNVLGTLKLLDRIEGEAKFVYVSTLGVYGEPKSVPIREDAPTMPVESYAASKLAAEAAVQGFCRSHNMPFAIARLFNVYGKGQRSDFVIPRLIERITSEEKVTIQNANSTRDFIHIDDVIQGIFAVALRGQNDVYNIGTGKETSIRELATAIKRFTKRDVSLILQGDRKDGRVKRSRADVRKSKKELGWSAKINLNEGIKQILS